MSNKLIEKAADNVRILSAAMVEKAKSGHPGGAMGGADFVSVLYSEFLNYDPSDMSWANRDRFFLDPGHMSPMLYSILSLTGKYSMDDLSNFRQWGSVTPGHPEVDVERGVENTSGPLGQGHTMAVGAAIAERFLVERFGDWMAHKTYTFISDGGVQEEISQGAGRIAGYLGLSNLIMFYDSNDIQLSTETNAVTIEDTAKKYEAWGWRVETIEGNNIEAITGALQIAQAETEKPTLIIGKTIMGKGAVTEEGVCFEGQCSTHGQPLGAAGGSLKKTIDNLGGDSENPFQIFPDVEDFFKKRNEKLIAAAAEKKAKQAEWAKANPELAKKLEKFFSKDTPDFDFSKIEQKAGAATRGASATVLAAFAEEVENMIVASADLSNSDKTDGFLKKTTAFTKGDFSGAFLQAGVCELTMAALMNGMALHGGIIPVCGTFFVFSDYQKPAVRLSALMELPVKFVWTHDAFRVGEDGPTHQPVEQEAQIRLLEKLKNHHGDNSALVIRPADSEETTVAWKMALENTKTPTALILSRQNIANLPAEDRYAEALKAEKGAYIVTDTEGTPDVILLASGSEVSTLVAGAELLAKDGVKCRIVSVPSEGLFRSQSKAYQAEVLPAGVKKFGMSAGLPVTLEGLVGADGFVFGMESFGFSAPYTVLDEKLGFTGQNVYNQVKKLLA
ncbi:transketolase family protein [Sunxiuqinia indica]|uniref:transketolase family protein n=1 Tax=Sunxiuqinia indica TaxID=2692584 RepID=UPI00135B3C50|nr:transketolase [Sunxiuqinia indica]